jgi:hypothetical protein
LALTPEQAHLRGKHAALIRWSREDPTEQAYRGQAGLMARFEKEVDPDGTLSPAERRRRAEAARRAHMALLSLKSSRARGRAKEATDAARRAKAAAEAARRAQAEAEAAARAEEAALRAAAEAEAARWNDGVA